MTNPSRLRLLVPFALGVTCACASVGACADAAESMARIRALIGDAACDDDSQCRTTAVGAKACGGPESYLAWSTKRTDSAALKAAVDELTAGQQLQGARRGLRSDCRFVPDPGASCTAGDAAPGKATTARSCRLRAIAYGGRVD